MLWLQSTQPGSSPLPAGGLGTLCLGSPIRRRAATTDAQGTVLGPPELTAEPGRQRYQVWYRDLTGPGGSAMSRVSDAVVVDLQ